MIKILKIAAFFILIANFSTHLLAQGYEIKIKIPALKDSTIILGHHFSTSSIYIPDDTVKLDKKGMGTFKGSKPLNGGMYFVLLPSKNYFDILIGSNQHFSITSDTSDFLKKTMFVGSPDNDKFFEYQNLVSEKSKIANKLVEKKKTATSEQQKDSITKALDRINQEVTGYIKRNTSGDSKLFFPVFLKALQDIEVPDAPRDANGKITDSLFQYRYYRAHYFDNFDLKDKRLLYTPLYEQKIKNYVEKVVPQIPDTINREMDMLIEKVKGDDELFRNMLVTLFNYSVTLSGQIMGMDAVFVHVAEKYYIPYATWSSKEYMDNLKKEVAKKKPNLVGNVAPDLKLIELPINHFLAARNDTALKRNPYVGDEINLHSITAKFLVVVFWAADCGHCKHTMPLLYDSIYPILQKQDVKVLAMHTTILDAKRQWIDFVNEHQMYNWINAWSPYSLDYRDLYDVYSTPVVYVLDENKKIIAKRIGVEQIPEVINFELKKPKR